MRAAVAHRRAAARFLCRQWFYEKGHNMNRNSKLLSILAVAFALALSMALAGCGQQASSSAASASASSASASAAASESASAASASASSASASASSASASASSASAAANQVSYTLVIDATEADQGILFDEAGTAAKGTTVYQALVETELPLEVDSSSYVSGIGNAIANDGKAGWMFTVNGEMPCVGADKVEIADGDSIEWKYYKDASKAM